MIMEQLELTEHKLNSLDLVSTVLVGCHVQYQNVVQILGDDNELTIAKVQDHLETAEEATKLHHKSEIAAHASSHRKHCKFFLSEKGCYKSANLCKFLHDQNLKDKKSQSQTTSNSNKSEHDQAYSLFTRLPVDPNHSPLSRRKWLVDSGCSKHMTGTDAGMTTITPSQIPIEMADNSIIYSKHEGSLQIQPGISINALYVPDLKQTSLLSVYEAVQGNRKFEFDENHCQLIDKSTNEVLLTGKVQNKLYTIQSETAAKTSISLKLWHTRMGHRNLPDCRRIVKLNSNDIELTASDASFCEPCAMGKSNRLPLPKRSTSKERQLGELWWFDILRSS